MQGAGKDNLTLCYPNFLTGCHTVFPCLFYYVTAIGGLMVLVAIVGLVIWTVHLKSNSKDKDPSLGGPGSPAYSHTSTTFQTTEFPPPMAQPLSPLIGASTALVSRPPASMLSPEYFSSAAQEVSDGNVSSPNQPSIQPFHPSARSVEFDPYDNSSPRA
jgi:hypothetical protein